MIIDDYSNNKKNLKGGLLLDKLEYINSVILEGFSNKQGKFNYSKLIRLINQLNSNYKLGNEYAVAFLLRSIIDHVPPLLGQPTFDSVVNNYSWGKTDRKYMRCLLESKPVADDGLHRTISTSPDLISMEDIPPKIYLNRLLQECLENGIEPERITTRRSRADQKSASNQGASFISLIGGEIKWANWSMGSGGVFTGFRFELEINNFKGKRDYINDIYLTASDAFGNLWRTNTLKYLNYPGVRKYQVMEGVIEDVVVLVTDAEGPDVPRCMPDIDQDSCVINIELLSEQKIKIKLKPGWIIDC